MTPVQIAVVAALVVLVVLLVHGRIAPSVVFSAVAFGFVLAGLIDLRAAITQFTNAGLLAVLVLVLCSVVLDKAHLLERLGDRLTRGGYRWALLKTVGATGLISAFLNNTAVVASMLGPLRSARHHPPSRLLLPMTYAASLGGVLTLVGTSTNLLVSGFLVAQGLPALHLLAPLPVGLMLFVLAAGAMLLTAPRLLPSHAQVTAAYEDYFVEAIVRPGSRLAGASVEAGGLRHLGHLFLAEVVRDGQLIAPVDPRFVLREGDVLVFSGDVTRLDLLAGIHGLQTHGQRAGLPMQQLVEVVVSNDSPLVHRSVKEVDFRARFDAVVVAVRRGAERLRGRIGEIPLAVGDELVLAAGPDFDKHNARERSFVVVSRPSVAKFTEPWRGLVAVAAFMATIAGAAAGLFDLLLGLIVLLAGYLALRFVSFDELKREMPYGLVFVIGSALIVSEVMESTGTAALLAGGVLAAFEPFGTHGALVGVLLLTVVLTEAMSNNAAAALTFPVAIGIAQQLGVSHVPFAMAVLFGASASFLTPYGYQTNLMVMGPGGYTLGDYLRAGAPVSLVYVVGAAVAIPLVYPFG